MPRARRVPSSPARREFESLWSSVAGGPLEYTIVDWDPDTAKFVQALLEILGSGASLFIRPGGGGSTVGIAIWEGDNRHPATWFTEHEELNVWAARVIEHAAAMRAVKQDGKGA